MQVQPYLNFDGRCEEAIEYYRITLGAEVLQLARFSESPDPSMCSPGSEDKIMHASLRIGENIVMASDGRCQGKAGFQGFSLSLSVSNTEQAEKYFAALSNGGQVQMPMAETFFATRFGMVADRFGVPWMILSMPMA